MLQDISKQSPYPIVIHGTNFRLLLFTDRIIHTEQAPFCDFANCPCHYLSKDAIAQVNKWYLEGLITESHSDQIIRGEMPL